MINWPLLNLQPINLFNLPAHLKAGCKHTHWAIYNSFGYRQCIDCPARESLVSVSPVHQR
jgi:hypothetical protein